MPDLSVFAPFSLGNALQTANVIKAQQQQSVTQQLQNAYLQKRNSDDQALDSVSADPNASLTDFTKAAGMAGVDAYGKVQQTKALSDQLTYKKMLTDSTLVAAADDPIAAAHQYAPGYVKQYEDANGAGSFDRQDPQLVKQHAAAISSHALQALVDPNTQFTQQQDNARASLQAQTSKENNAATIQGENARTKFSQGQENQRSADRLKAEGARSGFGADGQLDPKFDSTVDAILNYKAAPYQGASARSGPGAAIMAEVYRRAPSGSPDGYDATAFPSKNAALKSLTSGNDGKQIDAVNTAVQHLSQLRGLAAALNSGDIQMINQAKQLYQQATGNPAPTNAQAVANVAAAEVNKVAIGGPGAEGDRDLARAALSLKGSPEQVTGAIDNLTGLMAGRLNSTRNRFAQNKLGTQFDNMLLPETKAALASHGYLGGGAPSAGGAANAKTDFVWVPGKGLQAGQ